MGCECVKGDYEPRAQLSLYWLFIMLQAHLAQRSLLSFQDWSDKPGHLYIGNILLSVLLLSKIIHWKDEHAEGVEGLGHDGETPTLYSQRGLWRKC